MNETDNINSFVKENKRLIREWAETRLEVYKLKLVRLFSKSAGYLIWIVISLFLATLLIIFLGVTMGFWFSSVTGSYTKGFGIVTAGILALVIILAVFRKALFVNPIIRNMIERTDYDADINDHTK